MILTYELGGWARDCVRLVGSFRINAATTPDDLRDFNSNGLALVTRVSAGRFLVNLALPAAGGFTAYPEKPFITCQLQSALNPTVWARAHVVVDSWAQGTASFTIQCLKANATADTADAASDPDDNDVIVFELVGSISSSGTD